MLEQFQDLKDLIRDLHDTNKLDCSSISEQFNLLEILSRCHNGEHEIVLDMYMDIIMSIAEKYKHYQIFPSFMLEQYEEISNTIDYLEHTIMDNIAMFGEAITLIKTSNNVIQIGHTVYTIMDKYSHNEKTSQSKISKEQEVSNIIQTIVEISESYLNRITNE